LLNQLLQIIGSLFHPESFFSKLSGSLNQPIGTRPQFRNDLIRLQSINVFAHARIIARRWPALQTEFGTLNIEG
jgi:hypothetical protein